MTTTALPEPTNEALLENLKGQLDETVGLKKDMQATLRQLESHEKSVRKAIKDLGRGGRRRAPRPTAELDPHTQAGAKNLEKTRRALPRLGEVFTQAELGRKSGVGTGTLTWAIRALEADGVIEATGNVGPRRSREYRIVDEVAERRQARKMRPGS